MMARPKKVIDKDEVEKLAMMQCSNEEIAKEILHKIMPFSKKYEGNINYTNCLKRLVKKSDDEIKKYFIGSLFHPKEISLRSRISSVVNSYTKKYNDTGLDHWSFCGFTIEEFIKDIESKFESWMSWDNWGDWQIDHVIPRSYYKKSKDKSIFGLSNLKPVSKKYNLLKGSKYNV